MPSLPPSSLHRSGREVFDPAIGTHTTLRLRAGLRRPEVWPAQPTPAFPRPSFWRDIAERGLVVLGVLGMFGFVGSYVAIASGYLDPASYLAFSLASVIDYSAALLLSLLLQRRARARPPWIPH